MDSLVYFVLLGSIVFVRSQVVGYWKRLAYFVLRATVLSFLSMVLLEKYNFVANLMMNVLFAIISDTVITVGKDMLKWLKGFRRKYKDKSSLEIVKSEVEEYARINQERDAVYDTYLDKVGGFIKKVSGFNLFMKSRAGLIILKWIRVFNIKFHKGTLTYKALSFISLILALIVLLSNGFSSKG